MAENTEIKLTKEQLCKIAEEFKSCEGCIYYSNDEKENQDDKECEGIYLPNGCYIPFDSIVLAIS